MLIRPRNLLATAFAVLLPFAIACEPAADEPDVEPAAMEAPSAELEAASERSVAAWNGDDPAAVAAFFTTDAVAMVDDTTYQGRAEIEAGWLQGVPLVSDLELTETSMEQVGDDWRSEGTYSGTVSEPDADPVVNTGTYITTWTLDADGEWRIRSIDVQADEVESDEAEPDEAEQG